MCAQPSTLLMRIIAEAPLSDGTFVCLYLTMGVMIRASHNAPLRGRALVVEDDDTLRRSLAAALRASGFDVLEAPSCARARELAAMRPDVVIADLRLPDGDAVDLIPQLKSQDRSVPVYIVTGFATIEVAVRALKQGAEDFFTKPVDLNKLVRCVEQDMSRRRSTASGTRLRSLSDGQRPRSSAMRQLEDEIACLRAADCPVLILGETGTGKTMLARRIHELGARAGGPFVDVNCAGLSREFVESELFGHERGAFTGAHALKDGLFDAADGGTIFLDEIGDIDVQVQPKILKVLEERRFRRMGGVRERSADVRLIAATHVDLLAAVERREFRADLFYRISTVTLRVPALRDRPEDIIPLAHELLAGQGARDVELASDVCDKLASYAWPGNVRELKNVLQRAMLLRRGDVITADDVRFDGDARTSTRMRVAPSSPSLKSTASTLDAMEREHIRRALAEENGRVKDAALRLGIPRSTLYQKIKNHGITLPFRDLDSSPPSSEGRG